jgi:hypothetical protein
MRDPISLEDYTAGTRIRTPLNVSDKHGADTRKVSPEEARVLLKDFQPWKDVRRWIKRMVAVDPQVMERVSRAKFGDLSSWLSKVNGRWCGCLVGTCALVLKSERDHFTIRNGMFYDSKGSRGGVKAATVVHTLARDHAIGTQFTNFAGVRATYLKQAIRQDNAVALIKDEIKAALKARRKRG